MCLLTLSRWSWNVWRVGVMQPTIVSIHLLEQVSPDQLCSLSQQYPAPLGTEKRKPFEHTRMKEESSFAYDCRTMGMCYDTNLHATYSSLCDS